MDAQIAAILFIVVWIIALIAGGAALAIRSYMKDSREMDADQRRVLGLEDKP